jgi:flagellar basal body rod protein FlgG
MLYGLYQSALGADLQSRRLEITSNNMANVGTNSFKRDLAIFESLSAQRDPSDAAEVAPELRAHAGPVSLAGTATDFHTGALKQTGGSMDVAITGPGFFVVQKGDQSLLTRTGQFEIDTHQKLVEADTGLPLLSTDGTPLEVPINSLGLDITNDGTVWSQLPGGNKTLLGQLNIVEPADYNSLVKTGDGMYQSLSEFGSINGTANIKQGVIEQSNVEPMHELTQMMQASRGLEANLNMMKTQDQSLQQLLQSAGS